MRKKAREEGEKQIFIVHCYNAPGRINTELMAKDSCSCWTGVWTWFLPPVGVEYGEQLVFTEVLWGAEGLDLSKAVPQHLANARLRYRSLG